MNIPRILLLSGVAPDNVSAGGIFLHDLCLHYPIENICCFAVYKGDNKSLPEDLSKLRIVYAHRPREAIFYGGDRRIYQHGLQKYQKLVKGIVSLCNFFVWRYAKSKINNLIDEAVRLGRQQNVDLVWATLDYPILICMAKKVADALNVPLVTLVWDPPEYVLSKALGLDKFSYCSIIREFEVTLRASVRCGVMSEAMQNEYQTKYGVESIILRHGTNSSQRKSPIKKLTNKKQFAIGFAGSLYAINEWQALISSLDKVGWQIEGREVTITLVGSIPDFLYIHNSHIKYLGRRSVDETIDLMSKSDITYLPYWFDKDYRIATRLCFPTKLASYLAAGRPVLFHGPEDSSVTFFFQRFNVGICCHSLVESEITKCLSRFIVDKELYASTSLAIQTALEQELNLQVFLKRFASLIGFDEEVGYKIEQTCG